MAINPPLYEVHEPMNTAFPAPIIAGQTGSSDLDFFLAAGEQALQRAIRHADQLRPLIAKGEADGDIFRQAVGMASGEQKNANSFMQSATQILEGRRSRARKTLADNNPRPQVEAVLIVQRIGTLQILFDSLKSKDLLARIDLEFKTADETSRYILRGGEKWIAAYLESRQLKELDLIYYIRQNAGILESDLIKSCDELLTLPPLFDKLAKTKAAIESGFWDLCMRIVDWQKKPSFQANSLADLPDSCPVTAGQMRAEIRKLTQSRGSGFFNQNL